MRMFVHLPFPHADAAVAYNLIVEKFSGVVFIQKYSLLPESKKVPRPEAGSKGAFMISHVSACLLAHGEKDLISSTFCHTKREYSFSVRPIDCTPAFL